MVAITIICVGALRDKFYREAADEYEKRLGAFCKLKTIETTDEKLASVIPQKAYKIALCVEGKMLSSEELADKVGIAIGTVKRFEKSGEIQFNHLLRIALVLGRLDEFSDIFAPADIPYSLYELKNDKPRQRARKK
jgi:23S rRNA pseudoU1915 N3-methylase RlmH